VKGKSANIVAAAKASRTKHRPATLANARLNMGFLDKLKQINSPNLSGLRAIVKFRLPEKFAPCVSRFPFSVFRFNFLLCPSN
jgi:hypothetical protein